MSKKPINPISKKEKGRKKVYAAQHEKDWENCTEKECKRCKVSINRENSHRHHPNGRSDILDYFYVCPGCHDFIHSNQTIAKNEGFLKTKPRN